MKKIFKLAAIAVSMALVASLVACSSGDDDVVDASTPKYLVAEQINKYVDSIRYNQNVSKAEIESLETAHKNVMEFFDGCADCLDVYFGNLKYWLSSYVTGEDLLGSERLKEIKDNLEKYLKDELKGRGTEKDYHKWYVYCSDIYEVLEKLQKGGDYVYEGDLRAKVAAIGAPNAANPSKDTIVDGKLNDRQAANMKAYTDAVAALKAALSEDDKTKTCKDSIKVADDAIEAFNKLEKVSRPAITVVITAVDAMCDDISTNVCWEFAKKYFKYD